MSCSPFDLRDYVFGELPENDRRQVEFHGKSCAACREELERLRSTQALLLAVADEEIPQRIGFISDRVYEPSRWLRWWRAFWGSAPRLGFASAAMLSVALIVASIVSAAHRPAAVAPAATADAASLKADLSRQLHAAVVEAVAESDARHERRTAELLSAAAKRFDAERKADIQAVSEHMAIMEKYARLQYRAAILEDRPR